jgi:hypothetical protein
MRDFAQVVVEVRGSVILRNRVHGQEVGVVYRRRGEDYDTCRGSAEFSRLFQLVGNG